MTFPRHSPPPARHLAALIATMAGPEGGSACLGATGPQDTSLKGFAGADLVVGLGADPAARDELGQLGAGLGGLYRVSIFGRTRAVADLAGHEATENPNGDEPCETLLSEGLIAPTGVTVSRHGRSTSPTAVHWPEPARLFA